MAQITGPILLANAGSTGNVTGATVNAPASITQACFQFVVEAVGATPTVTFKFQGSLDGTNWYDIPYVLASTDTLSQATQTVTAVGASISWLSQVGFRYFTAYRVVTTANTNVTFRAELWPLSSPN